MTTQLTAEDLITEDIDRGIEDYLTPGKTYLIEIEEVKRKTLFGYVRRYRLFAREVKK